jgi:hypothetical protein
MTGFTIQETIISGLYLWETRKILRPGETFQKKKTRQVMRHLIWVNVFIIVLDLTLLATEYANLFTIQTVFKAAIYSVKLRFEFIVLNQLMELVQGTSPTRDLGHSTYGRGASRSVPLDTLQSRRGHDRGPAQITPKETYSVFVSKADLDSTHIDARTIDGVVKTTEVTIRGSSKMQDEQLDEKSSNNLYHDLHQHGQASELPLPSTRRATEDRSPTSSEVEFAGAGA